MMVELDKFFRCPNCQSYSLSKSVPNIYESFSSLFFPVYVYKCSNCSYRYVDKDLIVIKSLLKKAFLFIFLPLIVLSLIYFLNIFSDDSVEIEKKIETEKKEKINKPVIKKMPVLTKKEKDDSKKKKLIIDSNNQGSKVNKEDDTEVNKKNIIKVEKEKISKKLNIGFIYFGNSKKFGVNWDRVANGVQIKKISIGSAFAEGGIKTNDILTEINGLKIINGNNLKKERDKIFSGQINFADLKLIRNNKELIFRLIKLNTNKHIVKAVLKVRSSHPKKKEKRFRWKYMKKSIIIFRKPDQRVFIAGDFTGLKDWAVDDTIIINGKTYPGIKDGEGLRGRYIKNDRKLSPLEITNIIPPNKKLTLLIELANNGILFGNTDLFVVVK